mmetsp:Transcript_5835/g.12830  ORF Transcript_5835/g.12830 Transcript_5835/m.12830 type:complete len:207 (-) Transcript_5835:181-801(-)
MAESAESRPEAWSVAMLATLAARPATKGALYLSPSSIPSMASVFASRGSLLARSSFAFRSRSAAAAASLSRRIRSAFFFSFAFFSASPTRASSSSDRSFFFLPFPPPFFFDAAPSLGFAFPVPVLASSSAARSAAFSRRFRAASSAFWAADSARAAPRAFDPVAHSVVAAASALRADSASLMDWAMAFFSLAATAFWLGPPRGMVD